MPQPLLHDLYVRGTRRQSAQQDFVSGLRAYVLNDMANTMKSRFENKIEPDLRKSGQGAPENGVDVHRAMKPDNYFKFYSSMRYCAQEMVWRTIGRVLNENSADFDAKLSAVAEQQDTAGGSLTLDSSLELPKNVSAIDVHLAPGGYHTAACAEDCGAGALYDQGLNIFSFGMMGANLDDIGHSMANYIRVKFPDFKPASILDLGCTIGHNTCAWAQVYPDANVTGIDVAAPCLRYAHARAVSQGTPVHFRQMNATQLDFEDNSFDVVFSSMFLHELPLKDIKACLAEAYRVLKPGGLMLHMELPPNDEMEPYDSFYLDWDAYYNNEPFYKKFRDQNVSDLCTEAGFSTERLLSFITPQYTYMSDADYVSAVSEEQAFDETTGRLAEGVQWFGFGAWK